MYIFYLYAFAMTIFYSGNKNVLFWKPTGDNEHKKIHSPENNKNRVTHILEVSYGAYEF